MPGFGGAISMKPGGSAAPPKLFRPKPRPTPQQKPAESKNGDTTETTPTASGDKAGATPAPSGESGSAGRPGGDNDNDIGDDIGDVDLSNDTVRRLVGVIKTLKRRVARLTDQTSRLRRQLQEARSGARLSAPPPASAAPDGGPSAEILQERIKFESERQELKSQLNQLEAKLANAVAHKDELERELKNRPPATSRSEGLLNSSPGRPARHGEGEAKDGHTSGLYVAGMGTTDGGTGGETGGDSSKDAALSPQMLMAVERMSQAEARLVRMQQSALERQRAEAGRLINVQSQGNGVLSLQLTISRFSLAAFGAMSAGMLAVASYSEGVMA